MNFRTACVAGVVCVASLGDAAALRAQRVETPTLNEILERLETNLNRYDTRVPSFFCDEHVVSSQVAPGERDQRTVTDSVFRLKRTVRRDGTTDLMESREIKSVDGKAASSQRMDGPTMLSGAFEGGLAVVSQSQTACMNYTLERVDKKLAAGPYVVRFVTVLTPKNTADCLLQEKSSGRVLIDPATMQIMRLELNTPRHAIVEGSAYESRVEGKRVLTVEYAPVELSGESFWMPSEIKQQVIEGDGTFHKVVWSFEAGYRDYHKLEVSSRIVPGDEVPAR